MSGPAARPPRRALVLAAGLGSRLRAVSGDRPKPLTPFGGRSVLSRNLRWLARGGVASVWINLHHQPEAIRAEIADGSALGLDVSYVYEPHLLGTAGALANVAGDADETLLVVYGDNLVDFDLDALAGAHAASGALATLAGFDPARRLNTGIAGGRMLADAQGRVTAFVEGADAQGLVNAGVYAVEPGLLPFIPRGRPSDFGRDVFPAVLAAGAPLQAHEIEADGYCLGLDTPGSLAAGLALLEQGRLRA